MGALLLRVFVFLLVLIEHDVFSGACDPLGSHSVSCIHSPTCIKPSYICDGGTDCPLGPDEAYCHSRAPISCAPYEFQCSSGSCLPKAVFCNGKNDCGDYSDEFFCDMEVHVPCPKNWVSCGSKRCIQGNYICDGMPDCPDGSDEINCPFSALLSFLSTNGILTQNGSQIDKDIDTTRSKGVEWLLSRRKSDSSTNRWGPEQHRIAIALYLADERFFAPGNKTGEEIEYELTFQLLHKLSGNNTIRSQELALFIQALIVTCNNPRDFFGHNLVAELRRRVEAVNYTNPFEILTLCNAKDNMTSRDYDRVFQAFYSIERPFWTDTQAIATMAFQCLSSTPNVKVDEGILNDTQEWLKARQFQNGTVDNTITTALVVQALQNRDKEYFNFTAALSVLKNDQKSDGSWGSIRSTYHVLPAIYSKSYHNISSIHCTKRQEGDEGALLPVENAKGNTFVVQYSVWIGNEVDEERKWRVRVKTSRDNSFYDVIETVRKLDPKHNVQYSVIDNKPYVHALYGKEDDAELGVYWFTYVRSLQMPEAPKLIESSPVDVTVLPQQELILWYRPGRWRASIDSEQEEA